MTDSLPIISLVCFDLAGLVIDDSVVERAFAETIAMQGIVTGTQDYARSMVRFDRSRDRSPAAVLRELPKYDGWLVIEAEQDPEKATPLRYATLGRQNLARMAQGAGLL